MLRAHAWRRCAQVCWVLGCIACTGAQSDDSPEDDTTASSNSTMTGNTLPTGVPPPPPTEVDLRCHSTHSCSVNGDYMSRCVRGTCRCSPGFGHPRDVGVVLPRCFHNTLRILPRDTVPIIFTLRWDEARLKDAPHDAFTTLREMIAASLGAVKGHLVVVEGGSDYRVVGGADVPLDGILHILQQFQDRLREAMPSAGLSDVFIGNVTASIRGSDDCPPVVGVVFQVPKPDGVCIPTQCNVAEGYAVSESGTSCIMKDDTRPLVSAPRVVGFIVGSLALLVVIGFVLTCNYCRKQTTHATEIQATKQDCPENFHDTVRSIPSFSSLTRSCQGQPAEVVIPPSLRRKRPASGAASGFDTSDDLNTSGVSREMDNRSNSSGEAGASQNASPV
eukprot:TRINITY_DN33820_c0_g1_i1.p1 TRINITY_DN33820_c0_g1~~TRINITY_DN33820_c0_g1_i1.p1  ORF type:complete len:390 (+),score=78.95 TRINITY_DN33820_c0_g1_i1:239-1408(+)